MTTNQNPLPRSITASAVPKGLSSPRLRSLELQSIRRIRNDEDRLKAFAAYMRD